jgi:hypothetical protein
MVLSHFNDLSIVYQIIIANRRSVISFIKHLLGLEMVLHRVCVSQCDYVFWVPF